MELIQPPYGILPWSGNATGDIERVMTTVYNRLKSEDLYRIVFHERSDFTFSQFIQFFSRPDVLPQVCFEIDSEGKFVDLAGLCWLAEYDPLPSHTRATASFVFFKRYWDSKWTLGFAEKVMRYWFLDLGVDLAVGMTPKMNRAARLFTIKCGFRYTSILEGYTTYNGKRCDAMIAMLSKETYLRQHAEQETQAEVAETVGV